MYGTRHCYLIKFETAGGPTVLYGTRHFCYLTKFKAAAEVDVVIWGEALLSDQIGEQQRSRRNMRDEALYMFFFCQFRSFDCFEEGGSNGMQQRK